MPPKKPANQTPSAEMPKPGSRFHDMFAEWLSADATLDYDSTTKLSALWMEWKYGAPYDTYAINKLIETIDTFYGSCLEQQNIQISYGEFLQGGDLQTVGDLAGCLAVCP
jgi:hypothetical protein